MTSHQLADGDGKKGAKKKRLTQEKPRADAVVRYWYWFISQPVWMLYWAHLRKNLFLHSPNWGPPPRELTQRGVTKQRRPRWTREARAVMWDAFEVAWRSLEFQPVTKVLSVSTVIMMIHFLDGWMFSLIAVVGGQQNLPLLFNDGDRETAPRGSRCCRCATEVKRSAAQSKQPESLLLLQPCKC